MLDLNETLSKGEHIFNSFVDEIEKDKISDISIRRALKKYDVKNLKINNVTPLRAKKMYSAIIPKYFRIQIDISKESQLISIGSRMKGDSLFGVLFATSSKNQFSWRT